MGAIHSQGLGTGFGRWIDGAHHSAELAAT